MMSRAELLGQIMKNYGEAIAVSGTHGKTTTTSMLTEIYWQPKRTRPFLSAESCIPSAAISVWGGPELFVTEACEYTNSFLSFFPTMEIILNIEADHHGFL